MKKTILLILIILSFEINAFAQEKPSTVPFYPKNDSVSTEDTNNSADKENFRNSGFFSMILAYAAVRENDLSLCQNTANQKFCMEKAKNLLTSRYMAEGQCNEVKDTSEKDICLSLSQNDCSRLSGKEKMVCEGFLKGDLALIRTAISSNSKEGKKDFSKEILAIYKGFKANGNMYVCDRYTSGLDGIKSYLCEVVFGTFPLQEMFNSVTSDYVFLAAAKRSKDSKLCSQVSNSIIRKKCPNTSF